MLLTREDVAEFRERLTFAPITSTVRGLSVEVGVGKENGLDHASVINCDDISTVRRDAVGRIVGYLLDHQEAALADAVVAAFALDL